MIFLSAQTLALFLREAVLFNNNFSINQIKGKNKYNQNRAVLFKLVGELPYFL